MNGVGLPTIGRLLGHRRMATTAIYAHLDDAALHAAAEKAAGRIAKAMGFKAASTMKRGDGYGPVVSASAICWPHPKP